MYYKIHHYFFMEELFIIGRITLGILAVVGGLGHFLKIETLTRLAKSNKVPFARFVVFVTGVLLALAGLGVIFWVYIEQTLWFLAVFFFITAFWIHRFWKKRGSERFMEGRLFLWNLMLSGLILITIAVL